MLLAASAARALVNTMSQNNLFHAAVRETHQHVELLLVEQLLHQVSEVVFFLSESGLELSES
jgi:hypothetical protein